MSKDQVNSSNFSRDDYSGFYPHKFSISNREHSRFGPSMNPDLFLPNSDLGIKPIPVHLQKYRPEEREPSQNELICAKRAARECEKIEEKLGTEWLGIDYSDPNAAYNCFCNTKRTGAQGPLWPGTDTFAANIFNPPPAGDSPSSLSALPADIAAATNYNAPNYDVSKCGTRFERYVEYSKTNATFWNTPPKTPLYRRAQTALLMYNRIRILVHGDFNIKPGDLININYSLNMQSNTNIKKSRHDGRWMVYKIQRIITPIKHSMYLFLMRDGSETDPKLYRNVVIEG